MTQVPPPVNSSATHPAQPDPLDATVGAELVWGRIRRLFPPQAQGTVTDAGALAISWPLDGAPHRHATPILVRFEPAWLGAVAVGDDAARLALVEQADATVRAGMLGYNPDTPVPQVRVIIVG